MSMPGAISVRMGPSGPSSKTQRFDGSEPRPQLASASTHEDAAIGGETLPGKVRTVVGGEKQCGRGHFVRCPPACQRYACHARGFEPRRVARAHRGLDETRAKRVHADILRRHFAGERPRETEHPCFGRAVVRRAFLPRQRGGTRYVDDRGALALGQHRQCGS